MAGLRHVLSLPTKRRVPLHLAARNASGVPVTTASPRLVRDVIHDALYAGDAGYFVHREVIYAPPSYIDFQNLLGKFEYTQLLARLYTASDHAWLTPVLVFQPHYSYAIAKWLVRQTMTLRARGGKYSGAPLVVYEVGGGTGTNAKHILDYVKTSAPQLYRSLSYTILEISPTLSVKQTAVLAPHASVARSVVADATNLAAVGIRDDRPCMVVGCEVLDNMPCDKVVRMAPDTARTDDSDILADSPSLAAQGWREVTVSADEDVALTANLEEGRLAFREDLRALSDPDIARTLPFVLDSGEAEGASTSGMRGLLDRAASLIRSVTSRLKPGASSTPHDGQALAPGTLEARYVPTGTMRLLTSLQASFPRHGLWLADFDALPPPAVDFARSAREDHVVTRYYPAPVCSPLVASKGGPLRRTVDHPTYLSPRRGIADIFFPTDFTALAAMVRHVRRAGGSGNVAGGTGAGSGVAPDDGVRVQPSGAFLAAHADVSRTRTLSGFNPLLEDYRNTRVLTADIPVQ